MTLPAETQKRPLTTAELFDQISTGQVDERALALFTPEAKGLLAGWMQQWQAGRLTKAIQREAHAEILKAYGITAREKAEERLQARKQRADIREPQLPRMTSQVAEPGIRPVTGMSHEMLGTIGRAVEPLACIIEHGVTQVAAYSEPANTSDDPRARAGWVIKMCDSDAKPSADDEKEMKVIQDYIAHCGLPQFGDYVRPPDGEKPLAWKPGFEFFLRQFARSTLTYDWAPVRRWASDSNPTRYPCATFACVDPIAIKRTMPAEVKLEDGTLVETPYQGPREVEQPIEFVKLSTGAQGAGRVGTVMANYTADEMVVGIRNPRTEEESQGYGYCEAEIGARIAKGWVYGLQTNIRRFEEDAIPKGLLLLFASMTPQTLAQFQLQWAQNYKGAKNRFRFPILPIPPAQGVGAKWEPMDPTNRDMEYHQFMYWMGLIWHCLYKMHPASTGWEGMNPIRAPLSEGSPEAKFEAGQDMFLSPLLRFIAGFVTTEIIWFNPTWNGRYKLQFVGLGDFDLLSDAQTASAQLTAGIRNTEMLWAERDQKLPKLLLTDPDYKEAILLPMPFEAAVQVVMNRRQMAHSQAMAAHNATMQQNQMMLSGNGLPGAGGANGRSGKTNNPGGEPPASLETGQNGSGDGNLVDKPQASTGGASSAPGGGEPSGLAKAFLV